MPRTRAPNGDATTKVAEGIGRALARVVNRLASLDVEREKAYRQLLQLQARLNTQVARLGRTIGQKTRTLGAQTPARPAPRRPRAGTSRSQSAARTRGRAKKTVMCSICGTRGHNARGHAKWQASRNR